MATGHNSFVSGAVLVTIYLTPRVFDGMSNDRLTSD